MKNTFFLLACLLFVYAANGQSPEKRPLTFDDILKWNRITETHLSNDGKYVVYKEQPWKGDPTLTITTPKGEEQATFDCASAARITDDSRFVVFTLNAPADSVRILKLKKTKKEDLPKDTLAIYDLKKNTIEKFANIKSSKIPEKWSGWLAYQAEPVAEPDTTKKEKDKKKKDDDLPLFIKNLEDGSLSEIPAVSDYTLAGEKEMLAFVSKGDSLFDAGVYVYNLKNGDKSKVLDAGETIKKLTLNDDGDRLCFLADTTDAKEKQYSVFAWTGNGNAEIVVDKQNSAIADNWKISENGGLYFSDNKERLFFSTAPEASPEDTTLLDEEKAKLDIWHWKEGRLQTVQLKNKERDEKESYLCVLDLAGGKVLQLGSEKYTQISPLKGGDADQLVATSNVAYELQSMWEGSPSRADFYLVDIKTGEAEMIAQNVRSRVQDSPDGRYLSWYNPEDTTFNTWDIAAGKQHVISTAKTVQAADELNDVPNLPGSYRTAGWLANDNALLVYDRYDIWQLDPSGEKAPINLTQNGREQKLSYRLLRYTDDRSKGIAAYETLLLKATDETTKADSYYSFDLKNPGKKKLLFGDNFSLNNPEKARDADVFVFTKENFETYPNLIACDDSFNRQTQISDAAPQQKEFIWGTAELVSWRSLDGIVLEGTLHKPENFDPGKKYPMIVNFYERSSDGLLSYRMPENHRSTIDYHYYTSNGYVVFNPDVVYREGYPGESAVNCVLPGVNHIVEMGFVDPARIGAQGHSWGGYQVAYLATRTKMFAAIESGAPVVNMFSAYGGIRWSSGMNRSFQYEHTQSRIGKTPWEAPLRYLENSPLFTLDKVETPILIMHNDDDGAVPWYQGIEFFIGMRRLGKPAWMLNYNEGDHWPTRLPDMHDFQIRMAQFFDHYLKDAPMPLWMKEGIPATKKGIKKGFELVD